MSNHGAAHLHCSACITFRNVSSAAGRRPHLQRRILRVCRCRRPSGSHTRGARQAASRLKKLIPRLFIFYNNDSHEDPLKCGGIHKVTTGSGQVHATTPRESRNKSMARDVHWLQQKRKKTLLCLQRPNHRRHNRVTRALITVIEL